jgi:hypothetical protein
MEKNINVYSSVGDHIIKVTSFIMPERKMNLKQFENYIKNEVEGQVIGSFNVKRILCEPKKRFMPSEFEGFINNLYFHHRVMLVYHVQMFARKHRNWNYYADEQLRTKPIMIRVSNVLQKKTNC